MENTGNFFAGIAVAKGVDGSAYALGPSLVGKGQIEQFAKALGPGILPDQDGDAGLNSFRAFRVAAEDEERLAERWRFFLNATGIGDEQPGVLEQVDEVGVVQGFDEMKAFLTSQLRFSGGADVGIRMNGEYGGDVVVLADKVA